MNSKYQKWLIITFVLVLVLSTYGIQVLDTKNIKSKFVADSVMSETDMQSFLSNNQSVLDTLSAWVARDEVFFLGYDTYDTFLFGLYTDTDYEGVSDLPKSRIKEYLALMDQIGVFRIVCGSAYSHDVIFFDLPLVKENEYYISQEITFKIDENRNRLPWTETTEDLVETAKKLNAKYKGGIELYKSVAYKPINNRWGMACIILD